MDIVWLLSDEIDAIDGLLENTDLFSFVGDPLTSDLLLSSSLPSASFGCFGSSLTPSWMNTGMRMTT